jgi:uncharacterized protein (TIGR03437 family)
MDYRPWLNADTFSLTLQGQSHGAVQTGTFKVFTYNPIANTQDSKEPFYVSVATASCTTGNYVPGTWIQASPPTGSTPATVTVSADPSSLNQGTYCAQIDITNDREQDWPITVTFTVSGSGGGGGGGGGGGTPTITAVPATLNPFSYLIGGTAPPSQGIQLTSTGTATYTVSVPSTDTWLNVSPLTGNLTSTTSASLNVSINTTGLTAGSRTSTITINGGATPIQIAVALSVTSNASNAITASPASVALTQVLGASAASKTVHLSSTTSSNFTVSTPPSWLTVTPTTGTIDSTGADLTFSVNTSGLTAGSYNGSVAINKGSANEVDVAVNLTVTAAGGSTVTATPASINFSQTFGGTTPAAQTVRLDASSATAFTAAATASWLSVSPTSGTTPANLTLSVNSNSLSPGNYQTSVTIQSGSTTVATIPVTLQITAASSSGSIFALPSTIAFAHTIGGSGYHLQFVHLDATTPILFSATPSVSWLTIAPASGTTPTDTVITADATGMTPGTYQGTIEVDGGAAPLIITVQLVVTAAANSVTTTPASLSFTQTVGSTPAAAQTLHLSSGTAVNFSVLSGANWLKVSPTTGTTPADITVTPTPGGLQAGTYQDSITISGGLAPVTVPVSLTMSAATALISSNPPSVSFSQIIGQGAPSSQSVSLSASVAINFTAATNSPWLTISPSSGTTPATLTITANGAGLSPGNYQGTVAVLGGASPTSIPVTFAVSNPVPVVNAIVAPAILNFNAVDIGPTPGSQLLTVSSSGTQFGFTVSAATTDGSPWLTVMPSSGTSPATLSVGVAVTGLKGGQYTGTVTITPADPKIAPKTVNVNLTVAIAPAVRTVVNSASQVPGPISPGELITLSGAGLGPTPGIGADILGSAAVNTQLAQTRVLFEGIAAPLLFVSGAQINAVVPYGVAGMASTNLQVEVAGIRSNPIDIRVVPASPALFTTTGTGMGQAAIVNEDGTPNGAASAAPRGSVISLFGTGEGQTNPAGIDGKIMTGDMAVPVAAVAVTIAGAPAEVLFAGSAPGQVAGNLQINVRVPMNITIGAQLPISVQIGGASSQFGATVAVK